MLLETLKNFIRGPESWLGLSGWMHETTGSTNQHLPPRNPARQGCLFLLELQKSH